MPRKSATLRLSQTKEVLQAYNTAGLQAMPQARFMRDMISRMERNRYPTKRQRDWLDSIIEEGVPAPKGDLEYIAKIDEALATKGIDFAQVLMDFRGKLVRGYDLSEKQKSWCDNLIEQAKELRDGTFWKPDEDTANRIKIAVQCRVCYAGSYWGSRPGMAKAMTRATDWVNGHSPKIDEWTVEKLFKAVAGRLREMENPRFSPGAMGYVSVYTHGKGSVKYPCVVLNGPTPTRDGIAYDVLADGKIVTSTSIKKR